MKNFYSQTVILLLLAGGLTAQEKTISLPFDQDKPPEVISSIPNIEALENAAAVIINLNAHFSDPNDPEAILSYEISGISNPAVAGLSISGELLRIDFQTPGQTNVFISGTSKGLSCTDTFVIGVRPFIEGPFNIATFDDLLLNGENYWNGSDESGGFSSGTAYFTNLYSPEWFSWSGWAYTNSSDNISPGFMNQYSAISNVRIDSLNGKNYGLTYASPSSELSTLDSLNHVFNGFFITNSTYAALSMKYGDDYTKKFGGTDGNDPDWLNLAITAYTASGDSMATIDFKLADFSSEDNSKDYIIETWQWIDLSSLGEVQQLTFTMSSTDMGNWGMNTPAFFCMDNLAIRYLTSVKVNEKNDLKLYPNPSNGIFRISSESEENMKINIYDISGREVYRLNSIYSSKEIDISEQGSGAYFVRIENSKTVKIERIIIH